MKASCGIISAWLTQFLLVSATFAGPLDNCQEYTKMGVPSEQGTLLCRKGYALAHNPEHKTPDWVAEHLTREKALASMPRQNFFMPDPDLKPGERAELADYKSSGFDRGHMAPAGDMRWDMEAYAESFYLSNMVPQVGPRMNRGIWKALEARVRKWVLTRGELYIYTGPIYDSTVGALMTIGLNQVAVPTHLYKIAYDPEQKEAIAFIMPNEELQTELMPIYIVSVDAVEEKTGLDFLSVLSKEDQDLIESKMPAALWK